MLIGKNGWKNVKAKTMPLDYHLYNPPYSKYIDIHPGNKTTEL